MRLIISLCFVWMTLTSSAHAATWGEFLRGNWLSECRMINLGVYAQEGYTFGDFTGPEFQLVLHSNGQYSDAKCSRALYFSQGLGRLILRPILAQDPASTEPVVKGSKIAWAMTPLIEYPLAFYDKETIAEKNRKNYCGKSDWTFGRAVDLLKTNCQREIVDFYASTWFFLEVVDGERLRLSDKGGSITDVVRSGFRP